MHLSHQADQLQQRQQYSHSSVWRCVYLALGQATLITFLTLMLSFLGQLELSARHGTRTLWLSSPDYGCLLASALRVAYLRCVCFFSSSFVTFSVFNKNLFLLVNLVSRTRISAWMIIKPVWDEFLCITSLNNFYIYRDNYFMLWWMNYTVTWRVKKH